MLAHAIATVKSGAYMKVAHGIIQIVDIPNHPIFTAFFALDR